MRIEGITTSSSQSKQKSIFLKKIKYKMKQLISNLKGDKVIWSFGFISFVSVYACFSASSNLAYLGHGTGNTLGYLVKHLAHICIGFNYLWCIECRITILEQYLKWHYQLFDIVVYTWLKELLLQEQMQ
jgi:hypothetical protein